MEGNFQVYEATDLQSPLYGGSFSLHSILPSIKEIMKSMKTWTASIVGKHKNSKPILLKSEMIDLQFQTIPEWEKKHANPKSEADLKSGKNATLSNIARLETPNCPPDDDFTFHLTARLKGTVKGEAWDLRFE